jgi:hypothetical protein
MTGVLLGVELGTCPGPTEGVAMTESQWTEELSIARAAGDVWALVTLARVATTAS